MCVMGVWVRAKLTSLPLEIPTWLLHFYLRAEKTIYGGGLS